MAGARAIGSARPTPASWPRWTGTISASLPSTAGRSALTPGPIPTCSSSTRPASSRARRVSRGVLSSSSDGRATSIAYPFGEVDARISEAARKAGYSAGASLSQQPRAGSAPYRYPRVWISNADDEWRFRLKTTGRCASARHGLWRAVAGVTRSLHPRRCVWPSTATTPTASTRGEVYAEVPFALFLRSPRPPLRASSR